MRHSDESQAYKKLIRALFSYYRIRKRAPVVVLAVYNSPLCEDERASERAISGLFVFYHYISTLKKRTFMSYPLPPAYGLYACEILIIMDDPLHSSGMLKQLHTLLHGRAVQSNTSPLLWEVSSHAASNPRRLLVQKYPQLPIVRY